MKTCEGDLIETAVDLIFDVKGIVHPLNRIIAFIRYFPSKEGKRKRNGTTYSKVYSLSERYAWLRKNLQQYLTYDPVFDETLCEVPLDDVKKLYKPVEKLHELRSSAELDSLERKAVQLAELMKEKADVPWESIGISGSIMVGLHTTHSDIDPVIYGSQNCTKARSALEEILRDEEKLARHYTREELRTLFEFRSKDSAGSFESFVRTESRKATQGKFLDTDFFVRFVKDWSEIDEKYGDVHYRNVGYARIKAKIACDAESIFTPCRYDVEDVTVTEGVKLQPIAEIASFRGRFCEQARVGEVVVAQGKVEQVIDKKSNREYFRLLLGNRPSDFMILA